MMKVVSLVSTFAVACAVEHQKVSCGNDSKWTANIYAPETEGSYPLMVYITGGGGLAPGSSYSDLASAMVEKGMIVTMLSRTAMPAPKKDAGLESKAVQWLQDNFPSFKSKATPNFDQLVLSGHSAGNHVTCNFLVDSCGNNLAKAVVMMDPVDGFDPLGMVNNFCTTPGKKLEFDVPALLLRTGLDPVVKKMVACAPDKISNQRFFEAWSGPIWMVNATKYGHLDVNNAGVGKMGNVLCAGDDEPNDVYQAHIADLVDAFLGMVLKGDTSAEKRLNDVSSMKVDAEAQNDYNGHAVPFKSGCTKSSVLV